MLSETWKVWEALKAAKIPLELPHPLIKPLPVSEKNLLRIRLNEEGRAVSIENVADEERIGINRILKTNDGSFPVIKINQPILTLPLESKIWTTLQTRSETDKIKALDSVCADAIKKGMVRDWQEAGWNWNNSLEKAKIIIDKLKDNRHADGIVLVARRFEMALQRKKGFLQEIGQVALSQVKEGKLQSLKTIQELLVGKGKDRQGRDKKISALFVLELDGTGTIHRKQLWQSVANVLPTDLSATVRDHEHRAAASAFGGDGGLLEEPFPQIKLPVLGAYFPLISMASDGDKAKCNKRYGLTEYTICPVTPTESRQMAGALEWLVTRAEGTTWRGVASGKFEMNPRMRKKTEKEDLLVAFLNEMPDIPVKTASYFGAGRAVIEGQFEVDAKAVCDALYGIVREQPKSKLSLFLIREASDGQAQVALAESPPVKEVLEAAERWQRAAKENIPPVTIYLPEDRKRRLPAKEKAKPSAPYPDQVVRLLSHQWIRDGSTQQAIVGPGLAEVLNLMMRSEGKWRPAAQRLLNLLLQRVTPLLIGLFAAKHAYGPRSSRGIREPLDDYSRESRTTALRAVAVLGILLNSLDSRKENYMKDSPYQVGQMLALADTLHKDYCIVVRRGQLPNTLIGTSLMRRALDSPTGALADLSERIIEYVRWAKIVQVPEAKMKPGTNEETEESKQKRFPFLQAKKTLGRYQSLAESVGGCKIPHECDDLMKAQLLLGFLANPPEEK